LLHDQILRFKEAEFQPEMASGIFKQVGRT